MDALKLINPWGKQEVTLGQLRQAWKALRGGEAPQPVALSSLDLEHQVRRLGCSACDDDRHWVYLVRAGRLMSSVVIEEREMAARAAQLLAEVPRYC